eukprot:15961954-Heterocapsa_arctica.AAC.1
MRPGEEASPVQGPANQRPAIMTPQGAGTPGPPPKRKMVPQEVVPEYVGPRISGGQELARLFATQARERPSLTQEDFPR